MRRSMATIRLLAFCMACILIMGEMVQAAFVVSEPGEGCQSGKYIYYAFEMGGVRMGIMRYDIKRKKKKEIFSYKYKGEGTNGFYDITVKENYIYAMWDQALGTSESRTYIYRIAKDGSGSKRLAVGVHPILYKNRIYYEKCTWDNMSGIKSTVGSGKYASMKLDGSNKKRAERPVCRIMGGNAWTAKAKSVTAGGYQYFIRNRALYRKRISSNAETEIISCAGGVQSFYICGNYILVWGTEGLQKHAAYIVKTTGKDKHRLATWQPAE